MRGGEIGMNKCKRCKKIIRETSKTNYCSNCQNVRITEEITMNDRTDEHSKELNNRWKKEEKSE